MKLFKNEIKSISWEDFYNSIKVIRIIYKKEKKIEYLGQFEINEKKYNDLFEFKNENFDYNDLEYLDNFAREELAKKIYKNVINTGKKSK